MTNLDRADYTGLPPINEAAWTAFNIDLLRETSDSDLTRLGAAGWDLGSNRDIDDLVSRHPPIQAPPALQSIQAPPPSAPAPAPPAPRPWWEQAASDIAGLGQGVAGAFGQAGAAVGETVADVRRGLQEGWNVATAQPVSPGHATPPLEPPPVSTPSQPLDAFGSPLGAPPVAPAAAPPPLLASPGTLAPEPYPESVWSPMEQRPGPVETLGAALAPLGQAIGEANTAAQRFSAGDFSAIGDVAGALASPLAPVAETLREAQTATEATNRAQLEQLQQVTQTGRTPEEMEQLYQAGTSFAGAGPGFAGHADDLVGQLARARQAAQATQGARLLGPTGDVLSEAAPRVGEAASGLLGPRGEPLITSLRDVPDELRRVGVRAVREATRDIQDAPETATRVDKVLAVTLNNLFTPGTVGLNAAANVTNTLSRPVLELLEGRPVTAWKDVLAMAREVPASASRAGRAFVGGRGAVPGGAEEMMQAAGRPEAFPGPGGVLATPIARVNLGLDEFFRGINAAGAGAVAQARHMTPEQAAPFIAKAAATSVFQGTPSRLTRAVVDLGREAAGNPVTDVLWRASVAAFFPFVRTTEQVFRQGAGVFAAPAVQVGRMLHSAARRDPDAFREAFAKWALGTATWAIAVDQVGRGTLAGIGTGTPQEEALARNARDAQGQPLRQPEAARVAGRWFPSELAGPYGTAANWIASAVEGWQAAGSPDTPDAPPPDVQERLTGAFNTLGRQLDRDFYLSDFIRLGAAVQQGRGAEAIGRELQDQAGRLVPGLLRPVVEAADPTLREPRNALEAVQARIPGLSQHVPARIDPTTGEPVTRGTDLLSTVLRSPASGAPNPVGAEVSRLERAGYPVRVRQWGRDAEYAGMPQSDEQRRVVQETYGRETNRYVRAATQAPAYAAMDGVGKAEALNEALTAASQWADVSLGHRVARNAASRAAIDKLSYARYDGVKGTVEEIRRANFETRAAKNTLADYQRAYGREAGEERLYREDRQAWRLAQRPAVDPEYLRIKDRRVDEAVGNTPSPVFPSAPRRPAVGLGNTVVPPPAQQPQPTPASLVGATGGR